jgi:RNA-dependent RNA polymerase
LIIFVGTVLVTKNPCMWPGDFRSLTAVRNAKLEECMRDVIVFPVNGKRPHSNEISGSDLDGDQYWVYWGSDLKIEKEEEPLSYEGATKVEVSSIDDADIVNHIVETFGAGGVVGMIANTHTAIADQNKQHSLSKPCKELAELFSHAIDAPKTGKIIDKKEIIPYQKMCRGYPHFMLKLDQKPYVSDSILEKLFFAAKENYFKLNEASMFDIFPQGKKASKGETVMEIQDKAFKLWLDGQNYQETNPKKAQPIILVNTDKPNTPPPTPL